MYDKYFKALGYIFAEYLDWLVTSYNISDKQAAHYMHSRWNYLFPELSYFDWLDMISIYRREQQEKGSA